MAKLKKQIVEYRHYSLPAEYPVLLLSGDRWRISDIPSGRHHFHNCLEIGFCHTDSGIMEFGNRKESFKAGDVTCIPRHLAHTTYSTPGTQSLWSYIFLDPDVLFQNHFRQQESNLEEPESFMRIHQYIFSSNDYPKLNTLVSMVIDELHQKRPYYMDHVHGLLLSIYIELLRNYQSMAPATAHEIKEVDKPLDTSMIISPALDHIYSHYMKPLKVDVLADLCHLSQTHFRRVFNEIMGTSPLAFLNSTRIDEACKLLRSTEDSIIDISEKVGFNTVSSFNRQFSKHLKMTPREWRKSAQFNEMPTAKASILEFTGWYR